MNTLTSFIREHRDEIVQEWLTKAMRLPSAEGERRPACVTTFQPCHILPRLFDPFVEAPNSGRQGLGLGL